MNRRTRGSRDVGGGVSQHSALGDVWCGREMREWRATDVLPEVNVVLSAAQLSSRGCVYFSKRPEEKREQTGRE